MRDTRYNTINVLIESGHIKSFPDIFQYIPKTTVYRDLGINFNRFGNAIYDPSIFRVAELVRLAEMFGVNEKYLIDMAYEQVVANRKMKKKAKTTITVLQKK